MENSNNENMKDVEKQEGENNTKILIVIGVIILASVLFFAFGSGRKNANTPQSEEDSMSASNEVMMEEDGTMMEEESAMMKGEVVVDITGTTFSFSLPEIKVKQGDKVKVNFASIKGLHDFVIDEFGVKTNMLSAGESQTIEFVAGKKGEFSYYCSVGNHRQLGMEGKLIVE